MTTITRRRLIASLIAFTTLIAGCSQDEGTAAPSPSSVPSVPAASRQAETDDEIVTVYNGYQRTVMAASLAGDYQAEDLARYAAEPLLGQTRNGIYQIKKAGLINKGQRRWSPQITDVQLEQTPPTATVEDCTDTSKWIVVSRTTGDPAPTPSGRPTKYLVISTMKKVGGRWYVADSKGDWNRPC